MEVDLIPEPGEERGRSRLNSMVAITIALLATFMGLCKVKDDNIVQAMQEAQANKIDYWSWYQARNIREEMLMTAGAQLAAQALTQPGGARSALGKAASDLERRAKDQGHKKDKLQAEATAFQKEYDRLNHRDDQFDLSDAGLSIAIALLAITALTQKRWLYYASLVPALFGVVMGLAGFIGWGLHPDLLAKWLGT